MQQAGTVVSVSFFKQAAGVLTWKVHIQYRSVHFSLVRKIKYNMMLRRSNL
jgi:hypothetical protein